MSKEAQAGWGQVTYLLRGFLPFVSLQVSSDPRVQIIPSLLSSFPRLSLAFSFFKRKLFKRHKDQARKDSITAFTGRGFRPHYSLTWACMCIKETLLWAQKCAGNESVAGFHLEPQLSLLQNRNLDWGICGTSLVVYERHLAPRGRVASVSDL